MQTTDESSGAVQARVQASGSAPQLPPMVDAPESTSYRIKRRLLGKPLHTDQLKHERLGKPTALAVFASDCVSSASYATEEILHVLVPAVGLLAFSIVVPVTVAMLVVLFFLILSYRQTIKEYPSAGGAYIVTKDNFGPIPAQVAGVALLTDYILTVAVSVSAGAAALASAFPVLEDWVVPLALVFILLVAFGNLRGVKESGVVFAIPTYFFIANVLIMVAVGVYKDLVVGLPLQSDSVVGGHNVVEFGAANALAGFALAYVVLHAFASGGAAVTGVEAISNGVPAFKPPEWKNARTTLVIMGVSLGTLFLGISWLAHVMQVAPYEDGTPTVISEIGRLVYGTSGLGQVLFYSLQAGTMLILVLAANTSFADFPRLAAFAAGDYFMPRQLTKRGHRLVFSNGIVLLSTLGGLLVIATGAEVTKLIPLYAIGVFASFTLSQAGMTRHHIRKKEPGWRRGVAVNGFGAFLSFIVCIVIAVTKFLDGAYLILILVPILVFVLLRLNRQYEGEVEVLEEDAAAAAEAPILPRHTVLVLVDKISKSTARAIQYARTLTPDELRAVHVAADPDFADHLAQQWSELALSRMPLELLACPDRRIDRAVLELVLEEVADGETEVSLLVPRREYSRLWHRLLHDRTSNNIARAIARVPHANVTFVPFHFEDFDRDGRPDPVPIKVQATLATRSPTRQARRARKDGAGATGTAATEAAGGLTRVADIVWRDRVRVAGEVQAMRVRPWRQSAYLELTLEDGTGRLLVVFFGRRRIPGIHVGTCMTVEGTVGEHRGHLAVVNPAYEITLED
ncbi:MAG: amino acid permease [Acidimicrobiia bacterium]